MRIALYTPVISPHQLPLSRELVRLLGANNFRYIYWKEVTAERKCMGWFDGDVPKWVMSSDSGDSQDWLNNADVVLVTGWDKLDILESRANAGKTTCYITERWFKPPVGWLRLLMPKYIRIALRIGRLIHSNGITVLPIGVHAARELALLYSWERVNEFPMQPLEKVNSVPWMRMWGYSVFPGSGRNNSDRAPTVVKVLWAGRFLWWKRVDTLIRAVYAAATTSKCRIELTLIGSGVSKPRMIKINSALAKSHNCASLVTFKDSLPITQIRQYMHESDVYVLPSDGYEGWGAVVSEALEEGMEVFGTYEAGGSATLLPQENLFHAGDWRTLAHLLVRYATNRICKCHGIGEWSALGFAQKLIQVSCAKCANV